MHTDILERLFTFLSQVNIFLSATGIILLALAIATPLRSAWISLEFTARQRLALGMLGLVLLALAIITIIPAKPLGSTPIGTIVAYPGRVVSDASLSQGWMLCDGRKIPDDQKYNELRGILSQSAWGEDGTTKYLPDLRGVFLRGVDDPDGPGGTPAPGRDKGAANRYGPRTNTRTGDVVGSYEDQATALPKTNFQTNAAGSHVHVIHASGSNGDSPGAPFGNGDGRGPAQDQQTAEAGTHSHEIIKGGDEETRPINASVNFIIKAWQP